LVEFTEHLVDLRLGLVVALRDESDEHADDDGVDEGADNDEEEREEDFHRVCGSDVTIADARAGADDVVQTQEVLPGVVRQSRRVGRVNTESRQQRLLRYPSDWCLVAGFQPEAAADVREHHDRKDDAQDECDLVHSENSPNLLVGSK